MITIWQPDPPPVRPGQAKRWVVAEGNRIIAVFDTVEGAQHFAWAYPGSRIEERTDLVAIRTGTAGGPPHF